MGSKPAVFYPNPVMTKYTTQPYSPSSNFMNGRWETTYQKEYNDLPTRVYPHGNYSTPRNRDGVVYRNNKTGTVVVYSAEPMDVYVPDPELMQYRLTRQ